MNYTEMYTVEQARALSGYSQEMMAHKLGMSKNAYINKEKGHSRFYVDEAINFAEISGVAFNRIIFFNNDVP